MPQSIAALIAYINQYIFANGRGAITGPLLATVLITVVTYFGENSAFVNGPNAFTFPQTFSAGVTVSPPLTVASGGTNAGDAPTARGNLGAAASGSNSDITALNGLTTPITQAQGGTGTTTGIPTLQVANNVALSALVATAGTKVAKNGTFASGDGGQASYVFSTSPCSLRFGAGDGGSQIPGVGGCWNLSSAFQVDARVWPFVNNNGTTPSTTTTASGNGTTATLTYSGAALPVGSWVTVAGVSPSGYNGTFVVTASATNSVSYANTTTGGQTVAGTLISDDGPPLRDAAAWSAAAGSKIIFQGNVYYTCNSLDPTGLGCLVAGPAPSTVTTQGQNIGDTSIVVASATGIVTGMEIGVQQSDGSLGEKTVSSISGTTINLSSALSQTVASGANVWLHNQLTLAPSWNLEGPSASGPASSVCATQMPRINLGNNLNRPLIFDHPDTATPILTNMCLSGNINNQTGWAGGPGGKLYVIQMNDSSTGNIESSMIFHNTVVLFGYNGGIYQGFGRGHVNAYDLTCEYWGQNGSNDNCYYFAAYDSTFINPEMGSSFSGVTGAAMLIKSGIQVSIFGGAFFGAQHGLEVAGGQVGALTVTGTEFNGNRCGGYYEDNVSNGGTVRVAGHNIVGGMFDSNSSSGNGLCPDVQAGQGTWLSLISPSFGGGATGINQPNYNIATGTATVNVVTPTFGTTGGGSATVAWTDNASNINCANCLSASGTPLTQLQGNSGLVAATTQFAGLSVTNGTNVIGIIQGQASNNDDGVFTLYANASKKISLNSIGVSYFTNTNVDIGATAACPSPQLLCMGTGMIGLNSYTVSSLTTCTSTLVGSIAYVSDATTVTYNTTPTGGGSLGTQVMCSKTGASTYAWTMH